MKGGDVALLMDYEHDLLEQKPTSWSWNSGAAVQLQGRPVQIAIRWGGGRKGTSPLSEGTDLGLRLASDRMSVGEIVIAESVAMWQAPGHVTAYHVLETDDR